VQFFDLILTDAETAIDTVLIGLVGKDVVAELKADVVESLKGVEFTCDLILGFLVIAVTLKEDEYTTVLLLETLPEEDLVDVHVFLLLPHHLEPHPFRVQVVPVCLQAAISVREVQLVGHLLMLIGSPHLLEVRSE
jgi:hypothetical protein